MERICRRVHPHSEERKQRGVSFESLSIPLSIVSITEIYLYNFEPFKPHFYIVKLGLQGYTLCFLCLLKNIDCRYSLEPPRRGGSNKYPQFMFWAEIWKISIFLPENFQCLMVKFSIYLNRRVFVMKYNAGSSHKILVSVTNADKSRTPTSYIYVVPQGLKWKVPEHSRLEVKVSIFKNWIDIVLKELPIYQILISIVLYVGNKYSLLFRNYIKLIEYLNKI